jgi:signal peptidase I
MKPTLQEGQSVSVSQYPDMAQPARGDLIAFVVRRDNTVMIKRLVGLSGDRVQMINGALQLNGEPVKRERIEDFEEREAGGKTARIKRFRETLPNGASYETLDLIDNGFLDNTPVYAVPEGQFFVVGDNRDNSTDSRIQSQIGYIPFADILGRAMLR